MRQTRQEGAGKSIDAIQDSGFGLAEFMVAALIMLVTSASVYGLIAEIQSSTTRESEMQAVLNNTRLAVQTAGRYIRQAGNDPSGSGSPAITILSPGEVRITSDVTGSAGPGNPDKGDPDGDTSDSGEDIVIRYNGAAKSLEIVPNGGPAQIIAGYISGVSFRFYDAAGNETTDGNCVRKINITVSGASPLRDPRSGHPFGVRISSDFQLAT